MRRRQVGGEPTAGLDDSAGHLESGTASRTGKVNHNNKPRPSRPSPARIVAQVLIGALLIGGICWYIQVYDGKLKIFSIVLLNQRRQLSRRN